MSSTAITDLEALFDQLASRDSKTDTPHPAKKMGRLAQGRLF
jgi:hypothetical protein